MQAESNLLGESRRVQAEEDAKARENGLVHYEENAKRLRDKVTDIARQLGRPPPLRDDVQPFVFWSGSNVSGPSIVIDGVRFLIDGDNLAFFHECPKGHRQRVAIHGAWNLALIARTLDKPCETCQHLRANRTLRARWSRLTANGAFLACCITGLAAGIGGFALGLLVGS